MIPPNADRPDPLDRARNILNHPNVETYTFDTAPTTEATLIAIGLALIAIAERMDGTGR